MYPVNQVILGGDSMLNNLDDIDTLILKMELYRQRLKLLKEQLPQILNRSLIWDEIDSEINPMSTELKNRLLNNQEYLEIYNELLGIVLAELINLVKAKIENTDKGKDLLSRQLKIVRKLKSKIIEDTDREMEIFKKFKEYSKTHPNTSYEEFIKEAL